VRTGSEEGRRGRQGRTEERIEAPTYSKTLTPAGRASYASKSSSVAFFAIGEEKGGEKRGNSLSTRCPFGSQAAAESYTSNTETTRERTELVFVCIGGRGEWEAIRAKKE
jgi:hypothetical protein